MATTVGTLDISTDTLARRRRVRWAIVAALLVVIGAAVFAYRRYADSAPVGGARYVTAKVDRGSIEQIVTATGTLNPVKTVQVGTYVSGPIIAIDVDFNSPVKKGQRVAKIDPAPFNVKVMQAEANLQNAEARVQKDRADLAFKKLQLQRNQTLLERKLIAQNDLDTARSNYDQAVAQLALDEAAVTQARAGLEEARVNRAYTDILSPVDGTVVSRNVDVGQTVAASFQTPTLFLIAEDLAKMQVNTNVSESDVGRVRQGQTVSFSVDAYPGQRFNGTVAQVRNAPITVQNVVTYDVVVAVDNQDAELKPGMTANVTLTTARRDDVLRLPARALRFKPEEAKAEGDAKEGRPDGKAAAKADRVYLLSDDDKLRPVTVQVGLRDAQFVEILGGEVKEGDLVVVSTRRETTASPQQRPPSFAGGRRF